MTESPFGQITANNPFSNPFENAGSEPKFSEAIKPTPEVVTAEKIDTDLASQIAKQKAIRNARLAAGVAYALTDRVYGWISQAAHQIYVNMKNILSSAIKMAVFKFGIEMCALAIKRLVETMTGMNLTPPSIDTKGVWYNFSPNASAPSQTTTTQSRYDNPFGSPFSSSPTGW